MSATFPQRLSYADVARKASVQPLLEARQNKSSRPKWLIEYLERRNPVPTAVEIFASVKADLRRPLPRLLHLKLERQCSCAQCDPSTYRELLHYQDLVLMAYLRQGEVDFSKTIDQVRSHGLQYRQHDVVNIATLAVRSFSNTRGELNRVQKDALEKWKEWRASDQAKALCSINPGNVHEETLQKLAAILNDIFFLGQLPSTIYHVVWDERLAARVIASSCSVDLPFRTQDSEHHDICRIHPRSDYIKLDTKAVVAVVLHEMCHSFLGRYGCVGGTHSGCLSELCERMSWQNARDHGRAWQWLTRGIEDRMPMLLGFKRSLGRVSCLVDDMRKSQKDRPRFRPSICEIEKMFSPGDEAGIFTVTKCVCRALDDEVMWERIHGRMGEKWLIAFKQAGGGRRRRRSV
nr:hypothetical protein CFP56_07697 [Quercus suber]